MPKISKVFGALFEGLSSKQKEVAVCRFGLGTSGKEETLAAIGERLNLTRERVRQIENSVVAAVKTKIEKTPGAIQLLSYVRRELERAGGALEKSALLEKCAGAFGGLKENHLNFLSEASRYFSSFAGDGRLKPFYYLGKNEFEKAVNFIDGWVDYLNNHKAEILGGAYEKHFENFIRAKRIEKSIAENYLSLSKLIHTNTYGERGLASWPEIKPATARDRAYLVLKKNGKPMHFEEIAKEINEVGLAPTLALAPTVHNELIKDSRFVLVGRGIYALAEQGYKPGIARDVIKRILKKHGPLHPGQVIEHANKERILKPNTIVVNLQNKNHFERLADGRYRVREA